MPPPLPRIGEDAMTPRAIADMIQARAVAAAFWRRELAGHSLKRGAFTTSLDIGIHSLKLKPLGRHKSFDVLGKGLEFGVMFKGHLLQSILLVVGAELVLVRRCK